MFGYLLFENLKNGSAYTISRDNRCALLPPAPIGSILRRPNQYWRQLTQCAFLFVQMIQIGAVDAASKAWERVMHHTETFSGI